MGKFCVADFELEWINDDSIRIRNTEWEREVFIDGGDLESLFASLFMVRKEL